MMRLLAKLSLACGLCIIVLSLTVAAFARGGAMTSVETSTKNDTCLFCHVDAHSGWNVVPAPQGVLTYQQAQIEVGENDLACNDCHEMDATVEMPIDEVRDRIEDNQQRVERLKEQLTRVQAQHPQWQRDVARNQKSEAQIMTERISVIITVIEADGSWGFHDVAYTNEILVEAEQLMVHLLATLGL